MGLTAQHWGGERQTQAQRQEEAHGSPEHEHLNKSISALQQSRLKALFHIFHAPAMASSDVSVAVTVAGQHNLSEGVRAGAGLSLCDTAEQVKCQEGQSGECPHLIVRQTDSASDGVSKAAIASCNDRSGSCLYNSSYSQS